MHLTVRKVSFVTVDAETRLYLKKQSHKDRANYSGNISTKVETLQVVRLVFDQSRDRLDARTSQDEDRSAKVKSSKRRAASLHGLRESLVEVPND